MAIEVVPAQAGMSPTKDDYKALYEGSPRAGGDEPFVPLLNISIDM